MRTYSDQHGKYMFIILFPGERVKGGFQKHLYNFAKSGTRVIIEQKGYDILNSFSHFKALNKI